MTAYFDKKAQEIHDAGKDEAHGSDRLRAIEAQLVYDCLLATTFPSFPTEVRAQIEHAIRVHGVDQRPEFDPPADFDTLVDHAQRLGRLEFDLHSAFHNLAYMGLEGFTDSPLTPPICAVCIVQERMEDDAAALRLLRDLLGVILSPDIAVQYALGSPPGEGWAPDIERGQWVKWAPGGGARVILCHLAHERVWQVRVSHFRANTEARATTESLAEAVSDSEAWLKENL